MFRLGRKLAGLALAAGFLVAAEPRLRADEVLDWNATIRDIQAMRTDAFYANPGYSTRSMAMANGAMFDIMMGFDKQYKPYSYTGAAPASTPSTVNAIQTAAMAQASYDILSSLYGNVGTANPGTDATQAAAIATRLNNDLQAKLAAIPLAERNAGTAYGSLVALDYLNKRANDGYNVSVQYTPDPLQTPGHWQPDPFWPANHGGATQQAWGPNWGNVTPFLPNNTPYVVAAPPAVGSMDYKIAYDQVKDYGSATGSKRSQDQTDIGIFWAYDRPTMGPPPILYSKNLEEIAKVMGNSQVENARLFTLVSLGMADAGVASWEAKFFHDYWRPVTAIQNGGNGTPNDADGNPLTVGDPYWRPLGAQGNDPFSITDDFTPPFPAYPSGHATFGGVTYEILRKFYGTDALNYGLTSNEMMAGTHSVLTSTLSPADILALHAYYDPIDPNYVTNGLNLGQIMIDNKLRLFNSFSEAEWENAISRVYLGVHWSFDATAGVNLGNQIGDFAFANFLTPVPEPSTYALIGTAIVGAAWYRRRRRQALAA